MNTLSGEIAAIYESPLTEDSSINIKYRGKTGEIEELNSELKKIINRKRNESGIANKNSLAFSDNQTDYLRKAIKSDNSWREVCEKLLGICVPEINFSEEIIEKINIPWWASNNLLLEKDNYEGNSLDIEASITHSYMTQLMRKGAVKDNRYTLSISGIIETPEKIMVGKRGGRSFPGAIMTIPAGYVEYGEPLVHAFRRECREETGLDKNDITSVDIIGRAAGRGQKNSPENNTLYVFAAETPLSAEEVRDIWNASTDKLEHTELIEIERNPSKILEYLEKEADNILAPGAASLLVYCCRNDPAIIRHAEEIFGNRYLFNI